MFRKSKISLFCASTIIAAYSMSAIAAPQQSGTLTVGMAADIESTEYSSKHDHDTTMVLRHIYEGLVAFKEDMTIGPLLAESYIVSDDMKTYTFKLREGIKFHNGAPMTAADVKWSFEYHKRPDRNWGYHCREVIDGSAEANLRPVTITRITTPNDHTVEFTLLEKSAMFLNTLASDHCMYPILHKDSLKPDGSWNKAIATGPFMFKEWSKGQYVELTRFAEYKPRSEKRDGFTGEKIAYFDTLRFVPVRDGASGKQALLNGKLDAWYEVPASIFAELRSNKSVKTQAQPTFAWELLVLQTRADPVLADVRVRQAIAHAIDRPRVAREAYGDYFDALAPSPIGKTSPYYTQTHSKLLGFDPGRARQLLTEAGYNGQELKIMTAKEPYPSFYAMAQSIVRMLKDVGINATIDLVDWDTVDNRYGENDYQMIAIAFSQRMDPAMTYSAFVGRKADYKWYLWEDAEAEALVGNSTIVGDKAHRSKIFEQLHEKMTDWTPVVGIYNPPELTANRSSIKGLQTWPMGFPRYWGVWREKK